MKIFTTGAITSVSDALAINVLMDRNADHWARDITVLKAAVAARADAERRRSSCSR